MALIQSLLVPGTTTPNSDSTPLSTPHTTPAPTPTPSTPEPAPDSSRRPPAFSPASAGLGMGFGDGEGVDDGSGLQLHVLCLLRLLCQASPMCAQLVRSSGGRGLRRKYRVCVRARVVCGAKSGCFFLHVYVCVLCG